MDRFLIQIIFACLLATAARAIDCPPNTFEVVTQNNAENRDVFTVKAIDGTILTEDDNAVFPSPDQAGTFFTSAGTEQIIEVTLNDLEPDDFYLMSISIDAKGTGDCTLGDQTITGPAGLKWFTYNFDLDSEVAKSSFEIECDAPTRELKLRNVVLQVCIPVAWCTWESYGPCDVTCGDGTKTRERVCECPNPDPTRFFCDGPDSQTAPCSEDCCPEPSSWGAWGAFGECSKPCEGGEKEQTRTCIDPECPDNKGCTGPTSRTAPCNTHCCPVAPEWSDYGDYSKCTVTCGGGTKTRERQCLKDECHDGTECPGRNKDTVPCNEDCCQVAPEWSDYGDYSKCTVTCGGGTKTRERQCLKDECHDGTECPGSKTDTVPCNEDCCPVAPEWSDFGDYSKCTVTCGGGSKTRERQCIKDDECHDGTECPGKKKETASCGEDCCPVDCYWTEWTLWTECTVSCGGGSTQRTRTKVEDIDCPGSACAGIGLEMESCNPQCCEEPPSWSEYGPYDSCTVTCGGGEKERKRTCERADCDDGSDCPGSDTETTACGTDCCPEPPKWRKWSAWGDCDVTCGTGVQTRTRKCKRARVCPEVGGKCEGPKTETQVCEMECCVEKKDFLNQADMEVFIERSGNPSKAEIISGTDVLKGGLKTNFIYNNSDGEQRIIVNFMTTKTVLEIGIATWLTDGCHLTTVPDLWKSSQVLPDTARSKIRFYAPAGGVAIDSFMLKFNFPTGEVVIRDLFVKVCI